MTTLIGWVGVDAVPASLYLAADSRITWGATVSWDCGRKLYASRTVPHVLGYCGEAFFPTNVLAQLMEHLDAGLLLPEEWLPEQAFLAVEAFVTQALSTYPAMDPFWIVHACRVGTGRKARFHAKSSEFSGRRLVGSKMLEIPRSSGLMCCLGSGAFAFDKARKAWGDSDVGGTSRAVFSAFCDSVRGGGDPKSGGSPQLVGLKARGPGHSYGVVWNRTAHFHGSEVLGAVDRSQLTWYNELFELCDGTTLARRSKAKRHARPRGL